MMLWGATDTMAGLSAMLTHAKWLSLVVGVILLLGAVMGQLRPKTVLKNGK
jgi:hypothetical protein